MYMMSIRYLLSRQVVRGAIALREPTVRPARRIRTDNCRGCFAAENNGEESG